jgi:hypothetical protein
MEMTNGEIVQNELSGDYWQTAREVAERARLAGWVMTTDRARGILHVLVRRGVAVQEIRKGNVPSLRKVQMFRLKGDGGE